MEQQTETAQNQKSQNSTNGSNGSPYDGVGAKKEVKSSSGLTEAQLRSNEKLLSEAVRSVEGFNSGEHSRTNAMIVIGSSETVENPDGGDILTIGMAGSDASMIYALSQAMGKAPEIRRIFSLAVKYANRQNESRTEISSLEDFLSFLKSRTER